MSIIYDKIIAIANHVIHKASDRELSGPQFNEKVFADSKITIPKLNLDRTRVKIEKESISYHNAPPGISFSLSGNSIIEYALYDIPITGDIQLFGTLVGRHIDRQSAYVESSVLHYKEYSNIVITGNDILINDIKKRVVQLTNKITATLKEFENDMEQFYENTLKSNIEAGIESEKIKRDLKSDSESKLNPFI